jgi:hypothetical protein
MWIASIALAVTLVLATTPASCGDGRTSTHPEGKHGCQNSWGPLVAVQFGSAAAKVRASLRVKCDTEAIATFMARIAVEHKDGLFSDWYEVDYDHYHEPPGLAHSYTLLSSPCRNGSYRARASIRGTFVNGAPYKVTDETNSTRVDCERPERIT